MKMMLGAIPATSRLWVRIKPRRLGTDRVSTSAPGRRHGILPRGRAWIATKPARAYWSHAAAIASIAQKACAPIQAVASVKIVRTRTTAVLENTPTSTACAWTRLRARRARRAVVQAVRHAPAGCPRDPVPRVLRPPAEQTATASRDEPFSI